MPTYAEQRALLKQIVNTLAKLQKIEEDAAKMRLELSNASQLFLLGQNQVTTTRLVAFKQRLGRLSKVYLDLDESVYDVERIVDKIQP